MTVLEQLVRTVPAKPEWANLLAEMGDRVDSPTCDTWGRKGGSHYKDGQFSKK